MDGSRFSNFSIDHILAPNVRPCAAPPRVPLHSVLLAPEASSHRPDPPGVLLPPLTYRDPGCGGCSSDSCGGFIFHLPEFDHNCFFRDPRGEPGCATMAGHLGHPGNLSDPDAMQPSQRPRVRTVFTEEQRRELEALFARTCYPAADGRAQLARRSGLSPETVRVWFKNRRARTKRQLGPPSKSSFPAASNKERNMMAVFL